MCYISIVPARKQVYERKFVQNNLYLNSTMVRKQNVQFEHKVLINSKFFEQRKIAKHFELLSNLQRLYITQVICNTIFVEFDPGSGQTLAACFKHASRTEVRFSTECSYTGYSVENLPLVADG